MYEWHQLLGQFYHRRMARRYPREGVEGTGQGAAKVFPPLFMTPVQSEYKDQTRNRVYLKRYRHVLGCTMSKKTYAQSSCLFSLIFLLRI